MKIPFIKVHIVTEETLEKIKKTCHAMHGNDTKHIHNLMVDMAKLLLERQQLIKLINQLRKPVKKKRKKTKIKTDCIPQRRKGAEKKKDTKKGKK